MGLFSNDITGIDIGAGSIKVVRIAKNGKRPILLSASLIEFPPDAVQTMHIGSDLRHLQAAKKIGSRNIITLMPGKHLTIRSITLPKMPLNELREAVRWEAKRHISYPVDSAQIEYLVSAERREGVVEKYDLVMVAAEREKVLQHLMPFHEARIRVSAVDANALALRNVLRFRKIPDEANTLVVDLGAGKTEINIFKGGILRFSRCVESGGQDMTGAVADALGIGLQEAEDRKCKLDVMMPSNEDKAIEAVHARLDGLLMEIRRSVDYYKTTFRERSVETIILSGGVSLMQGLKDYFMRSIDGMVQVDRPFDGLTCKKEMVEEFGPLAPRLSAAIGLALRKA